LESLIAMLAHYAALDRLLHEGLCRGDEPDLGWQADLACVFLGMGIFGANSAIKQRSSGDGIWTWWQIRARHQLPARVFGYAMALAAVARGERQARWVSRLGDDAMDTFQRGLRFLQRRGECIFDFEAHGTIPGCEKNGTGTFATADFPGFSPFSARSPSHFFTASPRGRQRPLHAPERQGADRHLPLGQTCSRISP
jgi:hypothetical protein